MNQTLNQTLNQKTQTKDFISRRLPLAFSGFLALCAVMPACASKSPAPDVRPPAATASAAANQDPAPGIFLAETDEGNLSGLTLESPALQERLRKDARDYVLIRKGKASPSLRRARVESCQQDEPADAYEASFCRLILKAAGIKRKSSKARSSLAKATQKRVRTLVRALEGARMDELAHASDSEIMCSLKKVTSVDRLRVSIEKALSNENCASTALLTGLGFKTEEKFPEPDYKQLAQALYQRSSECGSDAAAVKATYRLGLIQVWDQKYAEAEASFSKIMDNPEAGDFRSRVVYWRYFSAKQVGDSRLQNEMKALLAKESPMTLHGLLTLGASTPIPRAHVAFKSAHQPQLDSAVRVAEALQAEGAREASIDALTPILEQLKTSEPEFQLYVGLLFKRAGDSLNKFKLLTGLFRDHPLLISKESLEMLFPLHLFETVRGYEAKADPYLVTSLMRQESAFNERARSRVGAMGLMQLMPQTARRMERVSRLALFDPKINIRLGVRFFSLLTDRYQGEIEMALAAYNAGPEKVDLWMQRYPVENRLLFVDLIPFRETREYVASIARNYFWYKKLYTEQRPPAKERAPATIEKVAFSKLFSS